MRLLAQWNTSDVIMLDGFDEYELVQIDEYDVQPAVLEGSGVSFDEAIGDRVLDSQHTRRGLRGSPKVGLAADRRIRRHQCPGAPRGDRGALLGSDALDSVAT